MSTTYPAPRFDDRQYVLDRHEDQRAVQQATDLVTHYALLGNALAEFSKTFLQALSEGENAPKLLTQEQKLRLLAAALTGR